MSDCNHEKIKCMKCHRYVGISDQVVPTAEAVKAIKLLQMENEQLKAKISAMEAVMQAVYTPPEVQTYETT